ncbi:hypothetical protein HN51_065360 [Arachis hypogaea]|uniref:AAA+ ATPase domain-containing protein n=1 Tax=Arachis hypogaea TaxID=3818 RepID=A0A444ZE08_ARAHY|nr:uncharacterized protein DS421_14g455320 [Arachis hypogaea]RYR12419.1 hypothetical protein Ahy_B04g069964 [Arachis hypogaea]
MEGKVEVPVIIAMKGHPGTGKSTLAHSIASTLKIPLLDKDDIKDAVVSLQNATTSQSRPHPLPPSFLNDVSYDALWHLAATQLRIRLSIVIDSPLSRSHHLDRLLRIAADAAAKVVVVECRPSSEAEWRRRLERRGGEGHKPATWREIEKLLEGYGGCTEYDVGDVPKMVVDTTANVAVEEMCSAVVEFVLSHARV